jgi:hypothetical protein
LESEVATLLLGAHIQRKLLSEGEVQAHRWRPILPLPQRRMGDVQTFAPPRGGWRRRPEAAARP